jgi:hypothetical protein
MSHHSYAEKRKDLRPWIDMICGWAEFSFVIGGIAFHKVRDLEERLSKMMPEPSPVRQEAIKNLHEAWRRLREITDEPDPVKRQHMIDVARVFMKDK